MGDEPIAIPGRGQPTMPLLLALAAVTGHQGAAAAIFQLDGSSDMMCSATAREQPAAEFCVLGGAGRPKEPVVLETGSHIGRKG